MFLKNLQSDTRANLLEFKKAYQRTSEAYQANAELLSIIKSKSPITNSSQVDSLVHIILNDFTSLDLIDGSINELINTGALNIIKDNELRKALSNWSRIINDYKDDIKISNDYLFDKLIPSTENKLLLRNSGIPKKLLNATGIDPIMKSNFEIDYDATLKTVEFENQIYTNALNIMFTLEAYKITENYLTELLELIEANITE